MTLRTEAQLDALFPDSALRDGPDEIVAEKIRDLIKSVMAVGGVMDGAGETISMTTSWAPLAAFTHSSDTKGITEDLDTGQYTILSGGAGFFAIDVSLGVYSSYAGWIEIAVSKNGGLTRYKKKRTMTAGGDGVFDIPAGLSLAEGDIVGIAVRGSGTADVTMTDGQFRVIRI